MLESERHWTKADGHAHRNTVTTGDRADNPVFGPAEELDIQVGQYDLRTGDRVSGPVRLAVLIKNVQPELRSTAPMQLGAAENVSTGPQCHENTTDGSSGVRL